MDNQEESNNNIKLINISLTNKTNNNNNRIIHQREKDRKKKVETNKWGLEEIDLSYLSQYEILIKIYNNITNLENNTEIKNYNLVINHIKSKIYGYFSLIIPRISSDLRIRSFFKIPAHS